MIFKSDIKEIIQQNNQAHQKTSFPHIPKQGINRTRVTFHLPSDYKLYTTKKGSNDKVNSVGIIDPPHIPKVGEWWRWNVSTTTKVKRVEHYFISDTYYVDVYLGKPKNQFKQFGLC